MLSALLSSLLTTSICMYCLDLYGIHNKFSLARLLVPPVPLVSICNALATQILLSEHLN